MNQPEVIKIDDIEYVRCDVAKPKTSGKIKIIILQRGHVMVGRYSRNGEYGRLDDAAVIRIWGTTKGLGEIAFGGPTPKTILDKCPPVDFHELTTIAQIECVEAKWNKVL